MLYIVPTPVGNLSDITLRALELFKNADVVLSEDSRNTRKLFNLLNIDNKPKYIDLTKSHSFNQNEVNLVLEQLARYHSDDLQNPKDPEQLVILVSDAGTPGVSDPGWEVVDMAKKLGVNYSVLPGATAFVPALVASGLVSRDFVFLGFLPIKKGRQTMWKEISVESRPVILYESVHRIEKAILEMQEFLPSSTFVCICREISKTFENVWHGSVGELPDYDLIAKGEFVIVVRSAKAG